MYPPPIYAVDDPATVEAMLSAVGLGSLVTSGPDGFTVTHLPLVYDPAAKVLRGHVSAQNPHAHTGDGPALVIFQGAEAYVTPAFYPSKAEHGRVAPTWNYECLHVHGPLRWVSDPTWLRANIEAVTDRFEAGRAEPWRVDDAPADWTDKLIGRIVGLEIACARVDVRRKMSQDKRDPDRLGVIAGLAASPDPADQRVAAAMAALEKDRA